MTLTGFGFNSFVAPVAASTPIPITPPSNTFPAIPAAPPDAICGVTFTVAVSYPLFDIVTTNASPLFTSKLVGVFPDRPVDNLTSAPAGSDSTTQASVVPRVIVAHPVVDKAKIITLKDTLNLDDMVFPIMILC